MNRLRTKIEMLNGKLSKRGTGSVEGQRKVEIAGFVSQLPLYELVATKNENLL